MEKCKAKGIVGDVCRDIPGHEVETCYYHQQALLEPSGKVRLITGQVDESGCSCRREVLEFIQKKSSRTQN